jgi:hypothetical protein
MQLAVDIGLALAASLLLSWIFLRLVEQQELGGMDECARESRFLRHAA